MLAALRAEIWATVCFIDQNKHSLYWDFFNPLEDFFILWMCLITSETHFWNPCKTILQSISHGHKIHSWDEQYMKKCLLFVSKLSPLPSLQSKSRGSYLVGFCLFVCLFVFGCCWFLFCFIFCLFGSLLCLFFTEGDTILQVTVTCFSCQCRQIWHHYYFYWLFIMSAWLWGNST